MAAASGGGAVTRAGALSPSAACERARSLDQTGQTEAAIAVLQPWLGSARPPGDVLWLAAGLQERLGQYDAALQSYQTLAAQMPWQAALCNAIGRVHACRGLAADALPWFDHVLAREPRNVEALFNRGNALRLLFRREEAIEAYRAVLPLHPEYARLALLEIARQQQALGDVQGAGISYLQLTMVAPDDLAAVGYRLAHQTRVWPPDPAGVARLAADLGARWLANRPLDPLSRPAPRAADQRLRVGLVSADLYQHPVGVFLRALLASSAAREVDWWVYDTGHAQADAVTQVLRSLTHHWVAVQEWSDERLARRVRDDGIDVLVDLSGYTAGHRLAAFALRPAPLQLSWLGYWGTTGLPFVDAVIADWHCVPAGEETFFTEPLLRLPHTRLCYAPLLDAPPIAPAPVLTRGHLTFGCFQSMAKIGPQVLAAWARIAQAVPEAHWVLRIGDSESDAADRERLRERGRAVGFAPAHLDIGGRLPLNDYRAAYASVDLMLDTFPHPGGTTTADALWMGVPTLTLSVPGMLGRQGEQMLRAAGMPEWVTHHVDDYVARAIDHARGAAAAPASALRPVLRERLRRTPLFDHERFGRDWIDAVRGLWRHKTGSGSSVAPVQRRLLFYVPPLDRPFGGVKVIYEQVAALNRLGFRAFTCTPPGSRAGEFWDVPKHEQPVWNAGPGDVVIAPEATPAAALRMFKGQGAAVWLFVQNWAHVDVSIDDALTGAAPPFDGALVVSDATEAIVRRCFPGLPCYRVPPAVACLPEAPATVRRAAIAYMPRKLPELARWLRTVWPWAFPDLADVEWVEIDGLPHAQVLDCLAQSRYFVSLQHSEGLGLPALEAMAAGCLVVGFAGIGGREYARPDNGLWVADGDGPALLEALGQALRAERDQPGAFDATRDTGRRAAARYSGAAQDQALREAFAAIAEAPQA